MSDETIKTGGTIQNVEREKDGSYSIVFNMIGGVSSFSIPKKNLVNVELLETEAFGKNIQLETKRDGTILAAKVGHKPVFTK